MWKRESQKNLKSILRQFPCGCILGARQVGKTTLARTAFPKGTYHDLESPRTRERFHLGPEAFLREGNAPLILDEVQFVPEIWEFLKVEIDAKRSSKGRFLLLGSANPALIRKASESLAGRIGFLDLDPLGPGEAMAGTPSLVLDEIWMRGGYPEPAKMKLRDPRARWMESYLRTFIERDLPAEGISADPALMRKLLMMVAHVHGGIWSASEIAASAGVSYHTVNRYVDILERGFLIRKLAPYFTNIGKRLVKSPKVYIRDSGLYHYLTGISGLEELVNSPRCGPSWEGFLIESIIRHANAGAPGTEWFYYRTQRGLEADLVLRRAGKLSVVEMKYGSRIEKRWLDNLKAVMEDVGADKGMLLHSGEESFQPEKGIRVQSARKIAYLDEALPG